MYPHFQRSKTSLIRDGFQDRTALGGTVASLVAFALMGWFVTSLMWKPIERLELESVGPEIEHSETSESEGTSVPKPAPAKPRKTNSHRTLTA